MAAKQPFSTSISLSRKPLSTKPAPARRKALFGQDEESDEDDAKTTANAQKVEAIEELSGSRIEPSTEQQPVKKGKLAKGPTGLPPTTRGKNITPILGNLSSSLESRKHAEAAQELNSRVYEYDDVYDSLKLSKKKKKTAESQDAERQPKYMSSLIAAAAIRKRDALIAEEKKIAREREAEGDEFAGKEKFVTEAYKKQQEENRRIEEEEKHKEETEMKKNKNGGMAAFYKDMLNQQEQRHAEVMRAAEERPQAGQDGDFKGTEEKERTETDIAREINQMGGSVVLNEDGEVVDRRQLLKGGLNVAASKTAGSGPGSGQHDGGQREQNRDRNRGFGGTGSKKATRERQSRMLESQLEQMLKRSRDTEKEEQEAIERAAKSRKTGRSEEEARARYLKRKQEAVEAEEAKKKGGIA